MHVGERADRIDHSSYWLEFAKTIAARNAGIAIGQKWAVVGAEEDEDDDDDDDDGDSGGNDLAYLRRENNRLRKENANRRRALRGVEKRLGEIEDKDKTDSEKANSKVADLEKELASLRSQNQKMKTREAVSQAASGLNFRDPSDAFRMIDVDEFVDEDGAVDSTGLKKALRDLAKTKSYLLVSASDDSNDDSDDDDDEGEDDNQNDATDNGQNQDEQNGRSGRKIASADGGSGKKAQRTGSQATRFAAKVAEYEKGMLDSGSIPMPVLPGGE